jgi:acylphosphatase
VAGRIRKEITFTGRVQGVGFRYSARSLARGFEVTGFVKNMPDGSVQMAVEGEPGEVDAFVSALKARMRGCIRDARETGVPPAGDRDSFEIAF